MAEYIENVNAYLSQMKIKQKYVSIKTGIDEKKLSCILNATQKIDVEDMEKIAKALGHKVEYFCSEDFKVPLFKDDFLEEISYYAVTVGKEQENFVMKLIDLIENIDEVLSVKDRFLNAITIGET